MHSIDERSVLSFDCYGTLIDWDMGIGDELVAWAERAGIDASRATLLQAFSALETVVQQASRPAAPYREVLGETLRRIGRVNGVEVEDGEAERFGKSVPNWPAFEDAGDALRRLQTRYRLVIVSNVDRRSFAGSAERLGISFDHVITADDVGAYKPHPAHFLELFELLARWNVPRRQLLHVAESLYHDHEPAAYHRIDSVWIHRRPEKEGTGATAPPTDPDLTPRWRFETMAAFADAMLGEQPGRGDQPG